MEQLNTSDTNPGRSRQIDTVMVVDDDDNWIFVSKLILKKAGVGKEIIAAKNGKDALTKLKDIASVEGRKLPDLIFLDIRMPVMDGFEFLEETSKIENLDLSQTKIYMCSSSLNPLDQERARLYPVTGFLTKPLTKDALLEIIG